MKKRIAFIKFAGLANSGVEKYLQTIAILLDKSKYEIDYFFTNAAPFLYNGFVHPDNSDERKAIMEQANINLVPIHVDHKIGNVEPYEWAGTDLWSYFDESKYDAVVTGRCGYPEYPFNLINKVDIIDTIHSFTGSGHKSNTVKAILLCKWAADRWGTSGGDLKKAVVIPTVVRVPENMPTDNLRSDLGIPAEAFVYGFHQGARRDMFNSTSLDAFNKIQSKNNYFIIMGGDPAYRSYVYEKNIQNVIFINSCARVNDIHRFLNTLNVFAHSRADGEVCSASIIEALCHGLPVLSHPAINMGHVEQIGDCGIVTDSTEEYAAELLALEQSKTYYEEKSGIALQQYKAKYDYKLVEQQLKEVFDTTLGVR